MTTILITGLGRFRRQHDGQQSVSCPAVLLRASTSAATASIFPDGGAKINRHGRTRSSIERFEGTGTFHRDARYENSYASSRSTAQSLPIGAGLTGIDVRTRSMAASAVACTCSALGWPYRNLMGGADHSLSRPS